MPQNPLGDLPLKDVPYFSRITDQYETQNKNYYIIGFNPGFALQASELNELQELFFMNNSLSMRQASYWSLSNRAVPFWEGIIPLTPVNVSGSSVTPPSYSISSLITNGNIISVTVNVPAGWYLWTDKESGLSFWIYLKTTQSKTLQLTAGQSIGYIGFKMTKETVLCCPDANCSEKDETLRDNSQGGTQNYFTCGASRFNVKFEELEIRAGGSLPGFTVPDDLHPIFILRRADPELPTLKYYDGQTVFTTT